MKENEQTTVRQESRTIVTTYTRSDGHRVKVRTAHVANYKAIITTISVCQFRQENGYGMETHAVFGDYSQRVKAVRTNRYAAKDLSAQHAAALVENKDLIEQLYAGSNNTQERESA